jgi:hypothetical protein
MIAETRETAEALKDFADRLEQIEKKYTGENLTRSELSWGNGNE